MKRREEYRSKVTDDNGLVRGRVPCPLLTDMGARAGDYLTFRLDEESNKVVMSLSRLRKKAGRGVGKKQGGARKRAGGKSRS